LLILGGLAALTGSPLEKGEHARLAVEGGMTLRAYAERIGVSEDTVQAWKWAADVAVLSGQDFAALLDYMRHLSLIHAAPKETWGKWVEQLLENGWTVEELRSELPFPRLRRPQTRRRGRGDTFHPEPRRIVVAALCGLPAPAVDDGDGDGLRQPDCQIGDGVNLRGQSSPLSTLSSSAHWRSATRKG